MTKLELAVIDNYIEWLETPKNRKLKLQLNKMKGAFLIKQWQKEKNVCKATARDEIAKLIIATLYSEDTWMKGLKTMCVNMHYGVYKTPVISIDVNKEEK